MNRLEFSNLSEIYNKLIYDRGLLKLLSEVEILKKHWINLTSQSLSAYFDVEENWLSQNLAQYNRKIKKIALISTRKSSLDLWRKTTRGHVTFFRKK